MSKAAFQVGDSVVVGEKYGARVVDAGANERWVTVQMTVYVTELELIVEDEDATARADEKNSRNFDAGYVGII